MNNASTPARTRAAMHPHNTANTSTTHRFGTTVEPHCLDCHNVWFDHSTQLYKQSEGPYRITSGNLIVTDISMLALTHAQPSTRPVAGSAEQRF